MDQNLSQYRIFYAVAKAGNISRAAKELYISQPAISKSISKLEDSLNTVLFTRNSRGVQLTDEGQVLFEHTRDAFEELAKGEQELKRIREFNMGHIRIGVSMAKMKTAAIKDEAARKLLNDALDDVESLATVSVSAMEQTTAKALRDAVKAGTVDREELLKLGKEVFEDVKKSVTPEAQRVITENLGSFDDYLIKCIEDAVRKVKQEDPYITLDRELLESGSVVTE